jgi:glycine hydroxymethyltransferase
MKAYVLVTGGTDNHMVLIDVLPLISSGQKLRKCLILWVLFTNKNMIPFDKLPNDISSGLRIGSPIMTTRGAKEDELYRIGRLLGRTLKNYNNKSVLDEIRKEVREIADSYPMFSNEWIPKECK